MTISNEQLADLCNLRSCYQLFDVQIFFGEKLRDQLYDQVSDDVACKLEELIGEPLCGPDGDESQGKMAELWFPICDLVYREISPR